MKRRIKMFDSGCSAEITFLEFLLSKKGKGLSDKTLLTYRSHFAAVRKCLDTQKPVLQLKKNELDRMIGKIRDQALAPNTIRSYTRTLNYFVS